MERVTYQKDKKKCALTFKIALDVPFSISLKDADAEKFKFNVGNNNDDVSKVLRDFLYKELGFSSKREIDIFLAEATDLARDKIYKKIGTSRTSSFSNAISKNVLKYNKKSK